MRRKPLVKREMGILRGSIILRNTVGDLRWRAHGRVLVLMELVLRRRRWMRREG
jgi:hypothetical protein